MIYLDNAATSFPKPKEVVAEMERCMLGYCGNPGRSGHTMSVRTGEGVYKARRCIGEFFGLEDSSKVIFTSNATESLNLAIKGVLKANDHVITTSMEHNSVLRPLKELESRQIQSTIVFANQEGYVSPQKIEKAIRKETRLIVCTHASNVSGTLQPIEEIGRIAKKNNIIFLVDASQSAGSIPINMEDMNIDMLALPGHKGLLGPMGTGILCVRGDIYLKPLKEGGTGTKSKDRKQPLDFPDGYESGTVNAPGIIGLREGVEFVKRIGVNKIRAYEEYLIEELQYGLQNIEGLSIYGTQKASRKTAVVSFTIEGMSCEEISERLNERYGIASRAGFHCAGLAHKTLGSLETGTVRLSVGPFNTLKEIRYTVKAIREIAAGKN